MTNTILVSLVMKHQQYMCSLLFKFNLFYYINYDLYSLLNFTTGYFTYLLNIDSKHMYFIYEIVILIKIVIIYHGHIWNSSQQT
jgi:hypothetical protein